MNGLSKQLPVAQFLHANTASPDHAQIDIKYAGAFCSAPSGLLFELVKDLTGIGLKSPIRMIFFPIASEELCTRHTLDQLYIRQFFRCSRQVSSSLARHATNMISIMVVSLISIFALTGRIGFRGLHDVGFGGSPLASAI